MPPTGDPVEHILEFVSGDTQPAIELTMEGFGDMTGYDFKMNIKFCDDGTRLVKDAIVIDDGSTGNDAIFRWEWLPGELRPGRHEAELELFFPGGSDNQTLELFLLDVRREIA